MNRGRNNSGYFYVFTHHKPIFVIVIFVNKKTYAVSDIRFYDITLLKRLFPATAQSLIKLYGCFHFTVSCIGNVKFCIQ